MLRRDGSGKWMGSDGYVAHVSNKWTPRSDWYVDHKNRNLNFDFKVRRRSSEFRLDERNHPALMLFDTCFTHSVIALPGGSWSQIIVNNVSHVAHSTVGMGVRCVWVSARVVAGPHLVHGLIQGFSHPMCGSVLASRLSCVLIRGCHAFHLAHLVGSGFGTHILNRQ